MNAKEFTGGIIGTSLSALGTALQVNELLQTISLVITIVGGIVSLIVVPLLTWYKNAKKDGKIEPKEIKEAAKIMQEGVNKIKSQVEDEDQREEIKKKKGNSKHG